MDSAGDLGIAVAGADSVIGAASGVAVAAVEGERGIRRAGASTAEEEEEEEEEGGFGAVDRGPTEALPFCSCDLSRFST